MKNRSIGVTVVSTGEAPAGVATSCVPSDPTGHDAPAAAPAAPALPPPSRTAATAVGVSVGVWVGLPVGVSVRAPVGVSVAVVVGVAVDECGQGRGQPLESAPRATCPVPAASQGNRRW